ncbi:putative G-protein coupled receptor Mth-like 3 [Anticarsia gemmatalis]|uniref:putative G-protein coupled receptor Mth-like 3 n=1 Tax=Anticarsia gemmatalis TaxID=129554 RepID=UPI003F759578
MKEIAILLLAGCHLVLSAEPCCRNRQILKPKGFCGDSNESMRSMNCSYGRMVLRDVVLDGDKVSTLDSPGFVFVEDPNLYCLGDMYRNNSDPSQGTVPVAIVCFEEGSRSSSNDIETSGILTLISVFFLVATTAFYAYLPQLRDLQGMCYMCMCISMALGFLSLGVLQLSPGFRGQICTITGFLVYTWMLATFFWMNVICINMYRTVLDATYMKKTERKQYFLYSCYAWGCTLLFLTVTVITNVVEGDHFKPGFGESSCWFQGRTETWIFFYGPVAVLISANVILFGLSSYNLWRETRKYQINNLNNLKHKFLLSLKLFLVMGISWVFEIASFAHGQVHIIWKIMDIFNCLQGVVIFLLLVILRRRAMQGLVSENCCLWISRPLAEKLSPHDDSDDQQILADDTVEVRLR